LSKLREEENKRTHLVVNQHLLQPICRRRFNLELHSAQTLEEAEVVDALVDGVTNCEEAVVLHSAVHCVNMLPKRRSRKPRDAAGAEEGRRTCKMAVLFFGPMAAAMFAPSSAARTMPPKDL
jgi:hypothetical protein